MAASIGQLTENADHIFTDTTMILKCYFIDYLPLARRVSKSTKTIG